VNACRAAEGQAALTLAEMQAQGIVSYIAFPEALKGKYQSYTEADISALRRAGYDDSFYSVEAGTSRYIEHLLKA
jgi:ADP-L-glycero-D-manno-heptose 6-epimerase